MKPKFKAGDKVFTFFDLASSCGHVRCSFREFVITEMTTRKYHEKHEKEDVFLYHNGGHGVYYEDDLYKTREEIVKKAQGSILRWAESLKEFAGKLN